jgi:membrane protease YdiL (CAAX protease family)
MPEGASAPVSVRVTEPARISRWRWWVHLVLLGIYPLAVGAIGWSRAPSYGPALGHGVKGLLVVCLVNLGVFAVAFGLAWLASRASVEALLLRWRGGWWTIPLGLGYSVALRLGLGLVAVVVATALILAGVATPQAIQQFFSANRPEVEAMVDVSALRHDPLYFWLSVTFVSFVLAGVREELWRSAFMAGLKNLWPGTLSSVSGQILCAVLAAVIFGFGHLAQGPRAVGFTGLLGLGLGLIMVFHRSIWPAVIAHGMFDATTMALLPWAMEQLTKLQP